MSGTVRIGIIGIGGMGSHHFRMIHSGDVKRAMVAAACDVDPARLKWARGQGAANLACFDRPEAFFAEAEVEAVLIATPHYHHPTLAVEAFRRGLHVLTEKPAGVFTKQVRLMNEAARVSGRVFAIMFNQRTLRLHQKMKDIVAGGELGELRRVNWIATDWFRSQRYYDSGDWRATWAGEGGGVLLNQCPHNLDLLQWICGLPKRVRAFCYFGKYHQVEVEDDVTAYLEYANGATGLFVATTGEAPGTNRLEISGDRGKLVLERDELVFFRNRQPTNEFVRASESGFATPECWEIKLPGGGGDQHKGIIQNWVNAILDGGQPLVPGEEGIKSLELSNAMLLSAWTGDWVDLPVDENRYAAELQKRIRTSRFAGKAAGSRALDFSGTF